MIYLIHGKAETPVKKSTAGGHPWKLQAFRCLCRLGSSSGEAASGMVHLPGGLVTADCHFQKTPVGLGEIDGEIDGDGGYFGNWMMVIL